MIIFHTRERSCWIIYEETDVSLKTDLSNEKAKLEYFQQQADEERTLQKRIADFKKALSHNEVLEEFDRGIFESIIEKVIVGGYDENGEKDPYKITFIYKTGFKNEIGNAKERFDKSKSVGDKAKELCSHIVNEVKDVCSYVSDNTCRDGLFTLEKSPSLSGFPAIIAGYEPVFLAKNYENIEFPHKGCK